MSLNSSLEAVGVDLNENSLPAGHRTVKNVKRLIAAVRAVEAGMLDEIRERDAKLHKANESLFMAQNRIAELEAKLRKYELARVLESNDKLSVAERTELIEHVG